MSYSYVPVLIQAAVPNSLHTSGKSVSQKFFPLFCSCRSFPRPSPFFHAGESAIRRDNREIEKVGMVIVWAVNKIPDVGVSYGCRNCSVSRTMTHHHPRLTTKLASFTSHTHARTLTYTPRKKTVDSVWKIRDSQSKKGINRDNNVTQLMYKSNT